MQEPSSRERVIRLLDWTFPPDEVEREVIRVEPEGGSDRPPILLVHGAGTGAWCWEETWMPELARRGWSSVALSLRGHGRSGGRDTRHRHTLRHYVHDVLQTIVEMDERPILVGHSMGALVVMRVLEQYAARAGVLLCPAPAHGGLGMVTRIARSRPGQMLRGLAGAEVDIDADMLFADDIDPAQAARWAARVESPPPLVRLETLKPRKPRPSKAPVMVIGSERDRLIPPRGVRRTAEAYDARLVMFDDLGHAIMIDAGWEAPLEEMTDWLETQ